MERINRSTVAVYMDMDGDKVQLFTNELLCSDERVYNVIAVGTNDFLLQQSYKRNAAIYPVGHGQDAVDCPDCLCVY